MGTSSYDANAFFYLVIFRNISVFLGLRHFKMYKNYFS